MRTKLKALAKWGVALLPMAIVCNVVWEFTAAGLYDCTDTVSLGFLLPGDWVHEVGGRKVEMVHQIIHGRSMSEPDTIKEGWSVAGLWCVWGVFATGWIGGSILLARVPWGSRGAKADSLVEVGR